MNLVGINLFSRVLAPAGGFPSPICVVQGRHAGSEALQLALASHFRRSFAELRASGTDALSEIFRLARQISPRVQVAFGGYTCPDLAVAALHQGLAVHLFDTDPRTLEPIPPEFVDFPDNPTILVLSNLYGLIDSFVPWRVFFETIDGVVIDDACQAAFGRFDGEKVGERGDFGVLSFGRGKSLCGAGGGAVLIRKPSPESPYPEPVPRACPELRRRELAAKLTDRFLEEASSPPGLASTKGEPSLGLLAAAKYFASWLLESPRLYSIPASLPFLGLGQTVVKNEFRSGRLSVLESRIASAALERAILLRKRRYEIVQRWVKGLSEFPEFVLPLVERGQVPDSPEDGVPENGVLLTRFPVLLPDAEVKRRVVEQLSSFGVSASYPKALVDFPDLANRVRSGSAVGSRYVADRLVTLPVHAHVDDDDIDRTLHSLRAIMKRK